MRWHIEIILELILFLVLIFRTSGLRWFDILIGVDLAAQILQIIPYRSHYPAFSALFWRGGVVLIAGARYMALMELRTAPMSRRMWWHARILCFWTVGVTACAWLMVGQKDTVVFQMNTVLLLIQATCYVSWIAIFVID